MIRRVILCLVIICLLIILISSGGAKDALGALYSASNTFLNEHYGATVKEAEEFAQLQDETNKRFENFFKNAKNSGTPLSKGVYNLEDFAPDLEERFYALFKRKYQAQPLTDRALDNIIRNSMTKPL